MGGTFRGSLARSVEGVEQQEDGADANHATEDQRVSPLAQIDFLDEVVDGREAIGQRGDPGLNGLQHPALKCDVLFGSHGDAYCIVNKSI